MRLWLILLATTAAHAAVVRGVTTEHASGLPLARTVVRLLPLPNGPGQPITIRTGSSGVFTFSGVIPGSYLLSAAREGFFPAAYGQRRPDGQGTPIEVTPDSDLFADLRLYRKGAITGRVLDENGVGMENIPMIAYRARLPLRAEGRAVSDDRGVYRIHGLAPGKYWVRSAAQTLDDGSGRLPTFGREAPETKDALVHRVILDDDTPFADVRPTIGDLFRLRGALQCSGGPVTVTLSSETMRHTANVPSCLGGYQFEGLAPGVYQVLATIEGAAGFIEISLGRGSDAGNIQLVDLPRVDFFATRQGSSAPANIPMTIFGRRADLSENGRMEEIKTPSRMLPGHWEITARVGPDQYVETIGNEFTARR